jgi:hypothetical protein
MSNDPNLIRYQVLAANRRHFSALFCAIVAFGWSFGLAVWVAVWWAYPSAAAFAYLAAGAILIADAFVAHRLLMRERSSFAAMCDCWRAISGDQVAEPSSVRPGAMTVVTAGQVIVGISALVAGFILR